MFSLKEARNEKNHRAILPVLSQTKEMPFTKPARAVEKELRGKFERSVQEPNPQRESH